MACLVCIVSKASEADHLSVFVTSQCGEDEDEGQWLVPLLSDVLASAEETQISKIWIIEPQKDKIGIFFGLAGFQGFHFTLCPNEI